MKSALRLVFVAGLCAVLAVGSINAAGSVKSGPQNGEDVPGPFHPLNVTGDDAGKKVCLFCKNGNNPVAMIFARDVSTPLAKLIKGVDAATTKYSDAKMGSFVVFLSDSEALEKQLKALAEKDALKKTVLSIDNPAGPKDYNVSKDADVTVVLYKERKVKKNFAFKKGELDDKAVDAILAELPNLPKD